MALSTSERRQALDTPYARDQERSVAIRMERGVMPRSFDGLLEWLREVSADELPGRIHKNELWRDKAKRGERAGAGSRLGTPAYAGEFEALLYDAPSDTDADGYYIRPFRAMCSRLRRNKPASVVWHVERMAVLLQDPVSGGWRRFAMDLHMDATMFQYAMSECIVLAWKEYQSREMLT